MRSASGAAPRSERTRGRTLSGVARQVGDLDEAGDRAEARHQPVRREQLAGHGRDAELNRRLGDQRNASRHLVGAGGYASGREGDEREAQTPAARPAQRATFVSFTMACPGRAAMGSGR